jgi:serine/threonine protein kinase
MDDRDDEAEAQARIGTVVGARFRLDALLGVGGMGAVYRATHVEIESVVAIKILLSRFASSVEVKERFAAEGRIANKVLHPGAVKITDASTT